MFATLVIYATVTHEAHEQKDATDKLIDTAVSLTIILTIFISLLKDT